MTATQLNQLKERLNNLSYDEVLAVRFADLKAHKSGEAFGMPTLSVTFTMDVKVWKSYQKSGQLGSIYGVDLGNYLSRRGILNEYCVPIVSDKKPARNGRKTISVEYRLAGHPYR